MNVNDIRDVRVRIAIIRALFHHKEVSQSLALKIAGQGYREHPPIPPTAHEAEIAEEFIQEILADAEIRKKLRSTRTNRETSYRDQLRSIAQPLDEEID